MEFAKWTVLIILFTSTDSAPTTVEQPSNDPNYTELLNNVVTRFFNSISHKPKKLIIIQGKENYLGQELKTQSKNGKLYNVTMKHPQTENEIGFTKLVMEFEDNGTLKTSAQNGSVFVEACLRDSNHQVVTEKFNLNCVFTVTIRNEVSADCSDFDQNEIKLLANDYQYKPDEETQIKNEIITYIKETSSESLTENDMRSLRFTKAFISIEFSKVLNNNQEHYYSIGTVSSTNYTLNNVTIYGLWNLKSISYDTSNLAAAPIIKMSAVRGSIVQNSPSSSNELNFKADNIYFSLDQNVSKLNVKIEADSVMDTKLNTSLTSDQSKLIIKEIESAFATSIPFAWKS